jgi:mRNA-degrading endonuclease toxin of MazEF toxin-antitoxin module
MTPRQGEIHYVDLPEHGGPHYVMVVPETEFNTMRMTLVVPFTSKNLDRHMQGGKGALFAVGSRPFLSKDSVVPAQWMNWIPTSYLDAAPIDLLPEDDVHRILAAIANYLGIPTYLTTDGSD